MLSIIIPIYNEEKALSDNPGYFKSLAGQAEVIFVDGGSCDASVRLAGEYGLVISGKKGRASQMNYGAGFSKNDTLLFLHADTRINIGTLISMEKKIREGAVGAGCLTQCIEKPGIAYRLIEIFGNFRARITKVFYGDQGIFVNKGLFMKLNGFPEVPVMEDILFTMKLRKFTKPIVLPDKIFVSPRRWEKSGVIKTIFLYSFLNILFWLKVPFKKIKMIYPDLR